MERAKTGDRRPPWHIRRTGFPTAWRLAAGRPTALRPVRVAVLDSGVDLKHSALKGLLGTGVNMLRPDELPKDENGHGTHVAGIIASASGAWWATEKPPVLTIHPVKIFDHTGYGKIIDIVRGLHWCVENDMDIINLSFGTDLKTSRALQDAVEAVHRAGVLLVSAAGNDGRRGSVDDPGRYPEVLAVAACTRADRLAPFSSTGPEVDLIAPGARVVSLAVGGGFVRMSGTSMAAPHVSAAAALLLAMEPHLNPAGVRRKMQSGAEWLPTVASGAQGAGLLRADRLLRCRPL